jgi:hypothetical protein
MQRTDWMIAVSGLTLLLHLQFADVGWQFRYEAYLVALSLFVLACSLADFPVSGPHRRFSALVSPTSLLAAFLLIAISYPLLQRAYRSLQEFAPASHNIFEQQFQMAQFLHQYYNDAPVAANDVGAISFYTNIHTFDLVGLGTLCVARELLSGSYTTPAIEEDTRNAGVRIAIFYDRWFNGFAYPRPPRSWTKVGQWTLRDNLVLGGTTVSFYATQPAECAPLRANLEAYATRLPPGVTVAEYGCK